MPWNLRRGKACLGFHQPVAMQVTDATPVEHAAFEFVKSSGGIEEYRLRANGLQVLLLPEAAAPVATFMVTYRVGSRNERAGLTGATHLLEHLMFKGTERYNKDRGTSIFPVLQRVGAQINAVVRPDELLRAAAEGAPPPRR